MVDYIKRSAAATSYVPHGALPARAITSGSGL